MQPSNFDIEPQTCQVRHKLNYNVNLLDKTSHKTIQKWNSKSVFSNFFWLCGLVLIKKKNHGNWY